MAFITITLNGNYVRIEEADALGGKPTDTYLYPSTRSYFTIDYGEVVEEDSSVLLLPIRYNIFNINTGGAFSITRTQLEEGEVSDGEGTYDTTTLEVFLLSSTGR